MPAMMSSEAYRLYSHLCHTVSARRQSLSWPQLSAARALAVELCEPDSDPDQVASFAGVLGLTDIDVEALVAVSMVATSEAS